LIRRRVDLARRASFVAATIGAAALASADRAHASEQRRFALTWEELPGTESCGSAGLARAVEERLGRQVFDSPAVAELFIGTRVEHSGLPPAWHATVSLRDRGGLVVGSRELQSEANDCSDLRDSLTIVIALMIDPDAPSFSGQASPPHAQAESGVGGPSPGSVAVEPRVDAELGGVVASGLLPTTPVGAIVRARFAFDDIYSAEAYASAFPLATATADRGASADFSLVLGGLAACRLAVRSGGGNRLDLCVGFEAGVIEAQGHGFDISSPHTTATLDAVAQGQLLAPLGSRFAVRLGAALEVPLVRSRFEYTASTMQQLFQRPPVAGTGELGLVVTLR
jgi:hypothetical protein